MYIYIYMYIFLFFRNPPVRRIPPTNWQRVQGAGSATTQPHHAGRGPHGKRLRPAHKASPPYQTPMQWRPFGPSTMCHVHRDPCPSPTAPHRVQSGRNAKECPRLTKPRTREVGTFAQLTR